jgi:hypothetical protein
MEKKEVIRVIILKKAAEEIRNLSSRALRGFPFVKGPRQTGFLGRQLDKES